MLCYIPMAEHKLYCTTVVDRGGKLEGLNRLMNMMEGGCRAVEMEGSRHYCEDFVGKYEDA